MMVVTQEKNSFSPKTLMFKDNLVTLEDNTDTCLKFSVISSG